MLDGIYVNILLYKDLRFACEREVKWRHWYFFGEKYPLREIRTAKRYYSLLAPSTREISALYSSRFQCENYCRETVPLGYLSVVKEKWPGKSSEERERGRRSLLCPSPYLPFFLSALLLTRATLHYLNTCITVQLKLAFPIAHARAVTMDFAASTKSYFDSFSTLFSVFTRFWFTP